MSQPSYRIKVYGWIGFILLCAGVAMAAEVMPAQDRLARFEQPGRTLMMNQNGPNRLSAIFTGTIVAYDEVLARLTVRDGQGLAMEFMLDTNTTALDHNRQIHLAEMRIGDIIKVFYNTEPRLVNRIERI